MKYKSMKKWFVFAIAFLLFIPFININGDVASNTKAGNILYVGGNGEGNYTSIQSAINDAENGYIIYVYPKEYRESIVINKSISLIGIIENGEKPVINGGGRKFAVNVTADGCIIRNFEIINHGNFGTDNEGFGMKIYSDGNVIEDNTIACNWVTMHIYSSCNTIANDTITDAIWGGIICWGNENTIIYNNISDNSLAAGIELGTSSNNTISWNVIMNNFHGMDVWGNNNTISYNIVCNNRQYGITVGLSSYNKILYNKICNNGHDGVIVACAGRSTTDNIIAYNNISHNGWRGIYLLGNWPYLNNNTIYRNTISYNGEEGIYLYWMCKDNIIKENNFIGNSKNAGFHLFSRKYHNTWEANYWDNWHFKLPKPIFGSVEETKFFFHRWINFDWHPALQPYQISKS